MAGEWYDIDWGKAIGDGVSKGIPVAIGAGIAAHGNEKAAGQVAAANANASRVLAERTAAARAQLQPVADRSLPGVNYLRNIVAADPNAGVVDPAALTPGQQIQLNDTRRDAHRAVVAGPLRGSGRATSAVLNDVVARSRAGFYDANRARNDQLIRENKQRGDQSAQTLAGQNFGANTAMAGQDVNLGVQLGGNIMRTGETQAGATVANTKVVGDSVGRVLSPQPSAEDVLSMIRGVNADERKGRYSKQSTADQV